MSGGRVCGDCGWGSVRGWGSFLFVFGFLHEVTNPRIELKGLNGIELKNQPPLFFQVYSHSSLVFKQRLGPGSSFFTQPGQAHPLC